MAANSMDQAVRTAGALVGGGLALGGGAIGVSQQQSDAAASARVGRKQDRVALEQNQGAVAAGMIISS